MANTYRDLLVYGALTDLSSADRGNPRAAAGAALFAGLYGELLRQMEEDFGLREKDSLPAMVMGSGERSVEEVWA